MSLLIVGFDIGSPAFAREFRIPTANGKSGIGIRGSDEKKITPRSGGMCGIIRFELDW